MKNIYHFIKNYILNGIYGYAIFGFYAVTVYPFVSNFIDYGEKSFLVFVFGFTMLVLEFFALNFKLKMIRIRAELKRIAFKEKTGTDRIPSVSKSVVFGLFMRMTFRMGIIMISMTALGYPATEKDMSALGGTVFIVAFFIDMFGFIYLYLNSGIYNDVAVREDEYNENEKAREAWNKINLPSAYTTENYWKEVVSDIILLVYAFMLFTAFCKYLNQIAFERLYDALGNHLPAFDTAMEVFPMLLIIIFMALMPMRIAYWIEDSMMAFTPKENAGMWIIYSIVMLYICVPSINKFIFLFVVGQEDYFFPFGPLEIVLPLFLLAIILIVQLVLYGSVLKKGNSNP